LLGSPAGSELIAAWSKKLQKHSVVFVCQNESWLQK
jgi:hypothetical protein